MEQISVALESFLAESPRAVVLEDGKVLFDMREAKYKLATEHGRCTLHLWGEDRNLVRRVSGTTAAQRRSAAEYASLRPDQTSDAGTCNRSRSPHSFESRSDASEVSACARAGAAAQLPRVQNRCTSHGDGSREELRPRVCAWLAGAGTEGLGRDRRQRRGDAVHRRRDPDAGDSVAAALPRVRRWPTALPGIEADRAARHGDADAVAHGVAQSERRASGSCGSSTRTTRRAGATRCRRPRQSDHSPDACAQRASRTRAIRRVAGNA